LFDLLFCNARPAATDNRIFNAMAAATDDRMFDCFGRTYFLMIIYVILKHHIRKTVFILKARFFFGLEDFLRFLSLPLWILNCVFFQKSS
jgi:hypothetical protein